MWFDAFAKLVEIVAPPCDIRDNCDTGRQFSNYCVADVASVATPPAPETETRARRPGRVYFPTRKS